MSRQGSFSVARWKVALGSSGRFAFCTQACFAGRQFDTVRDSQQLFHPRDGVPQGAEISNVDLPAPIVPFEESTLLLGSHR